MQGIPSDPRKDEAVRICVIGDVQGWTQRLVDALDALGADCEAGLLPVDTAVIQVGDLVHKGPDSAGAVALVGRFLAGSPGRWVQLLGNHEAQYLGGSSFWTPPVKHDTEVLLEQWFQKGTARLAVACRSDELGDVLVTHAGLTRNKWEAFGCPASAEEAAQLINAEAHRAPKKAFAPGKMLRGLPTRTVGVVWAEAVDELLWSWDMETLPFSLVHGHSSAYSFGRGYFHLGVPEHMAVLTRPDRARRHVRFDWPGGGAIIGIDTGYGTKNAAVPLVPLVLHGEICAP